MTINYDFSSSREAIRLLERREGRESLSRSLWKSLYNTEGYRILLENRITAKDDIKAFLIKGAEGAFPETSQLLMELEALSDRARKAAGRLDPLFHEWLPRELTFEQPIVAFVPYGGEGEDTDPAVCDFLWSSSLDQAELESYLLRRVLVLLIRRYQDLEKYYLKNFLPIRHHMSFITVLWDIQNAGLASLMEGKKASPDMDGDVLSRMDDILSEAAGSNRKTLEDLGLRFKEEISPEEAGILVYTALLERTGREGLHESLFRPTSPYLILRKAGQSLFSAEGEFFLDQLDSLLS